MASGAGGPGGQSAGRLRKVPLSNPDRRREVLDAVLTLLAEVGYERLTMDLVAQRARASKATLYQRWPSKAQLVVDALQEHQPVLADQDTGCLVEDVRGLLRSWLAGWTRYDRGLLIALLEGSRTDAELAGLRRERLRRPVRAAAESALARARRRGEIPAGVDGELLLEMPFALVLMHVLVQEEEPGPELIDRIVDGALAPLLGQSGGGRGGRGADTSPDRTRTPPG
ncbi:TetR/AcrR family transcriptional regulator [Kitasatospora sp. NPDC052896]|uniref:TetR/AcrR family transcriptional regulator n=1 Tax=Kitasatospora sp. NPDC052896 TaxID=3364061 RepID=UPI0037C78880